MSKNQNYFEFFFSKQFLIHFVLAIFCTAGILYGTLLFLDHYTLHGEEITVPDLKGIDKKELNKVLAEKNLQFRIIDSVYIGEDAKGVVIGQNPQSMNKVKKGRIIYITVNAMNPPSVKLPLLIDKSMRQAKSIIENIGLKLGELIYRPDQCVNCVLGQRVGGVELNGDTVLPKGSVVDLVLGQGLSDEKILVPLLINLTRNEAIERLNQSFLNLGAEVYDESIIDESDSSVARIFSQNPPYSAKSWLFMGSSVDVEYTTFKNKIDSTIVIDSSEIEKYAKDTL